MILLFFGITLNVSPISDLFLSLAFPPNCLQSSCRELCRCKKLAGYRKRTFGNWTLAGRRNRRGHRTLFPLEMLGDTALCWSQNHWGHSKKLLVTSEDIEPCQSQVHLEDSEPCWYRNTGRNRSLLVSNFVEKTPICVLHCLGLCPPIFYRDLA
jgi:hypothetical protein